jgi:hypothetical protein
MVRHTTLALTCVWAVRSAKMILFKSSYDGMSLVPRGEESINLRCKLMQWWLEKSKKLPRLGVAWAACLGSQLRHTPAQSSLDSILHADLAEHSRVIFHGAHNGICLCVPV